MRASAKRKKSRAGQLLAAAGSIANVGGVSMSEYKTGASSQET
jgi:hypothetical protein